MTRYTAALTLLLIVLPAASGCGTGAGEAAAVGAVAANTASAVGAALDQAATNAKSQTPVAPKKQTGKVIVVGPNGTTVTENGKTYFVPKPDWQK